MVFQSPSLFHCDDSFQTLSAAQLVCGFVLVLNSVTPLSRHQQFFYVTVSTVYCNIIPQMGVKGLWSVSPPPLHLTVHMYEILMLYLFRNNNQVVTPAAEQQNLMALALREGFEKAKGVRAYRLGVDIRYAFYIRLPPLNIC